jgi:putative methionine-R-sulfoxide reductase with GAF domain
MVKLMVILEANKSLAATFDPTETLRIILKTATSETDAERGTIFLKDPETGELVSQILEGGTVKEIRLPVGTGIAGSVAHTGELINVADAYRDARFDKSSDAKSGFKTVSLLAAPMRTPRGEIVGVVEILNKRRRSFNKEDEEFLAEVGTHAALAVEAVRDHEAAVRRARREGAAAVLQGVMPLLAPAAWPETPGFECAPLRWRSAEPSVAVYAVEARPGTVSLLLLEDRRELEESIGALVRAAAAAKRVLAGSSPSEVVERAAAAEPGCSATAVRWETDRVSLASWSAPIPWLLRFGRPVPFETRQRDGVSEVSLETARGDLLVVASSGLTELQSEGKPASPEKAIQRLARAAETEPLPAGFAELVADWKKKGMHPGSKDVLLLAVKRV